MTTQTQRTPGPWKQVHKVPTLINSCSAFRSVAETGCGRRKLTPEDEANAAFIVTACNAHDELVAALRGSRDMLRESAKQFRTTGNNGHAVMCDRHADNCEAELAKAGAA